MAQIGMILILKPQRLPLYQWTAQSFTYTVTGFPTPVLDVYGLAGASIDASGTLHIPDCLSNGIYTLTITATNVTNPDVSYVITLTRIEALPPENGSTPIENLQTGEATDLIS